jgi:hypothetical protein
MSTSTAANSHHLRNFGVHGKGQKSESKPRMLPNPNSYILRINENLGFKKIKTESLSKKLLSGQHIKLVSTRI